MMLSMNFLPIWASRRNPRNRLKEHDRWYEVRQAVMIDHGDTCYYCGVHARDARGLQLHESYEFDDSKRVMTFTALLPACRKCHGVIHVNQRPHLLGKYQYHYCMVNACQPKDFIIEYHEALRLRYRRNECSGYRITATKELQALINDILSRDELVGFMDKEVLA